MILHRVIEQVRKQEWTAIAIDFVIVVLGVFIGIQVSNWNEMRANKASLTKALERLEAEAAQNVEIADGVLQIIEKGRTDRELAKTAVSNCEETPEAVAALGRTLMNFTGDFQPNFVFAALDQVADKDAYQDLLSPAFSRALGAYNSRLNEEQIQLTSHYDKIWQYHVDKHPSVTAYFAGPQEADWTFALAKPFSDVCSDPTFRSRFVNTIGFLRAIERRLKQFKLQIAEFQAAIADELGHHQ